MFNSKSEFGYTEPLKQPYQYSSMCKAPGFLLTALMNPFAVTISATLSILSGLPHKNMKNTFSLMDHYVNVQEGLDAHPFFRSCHACYR